MKTILLALCLALASCAVTTDNQSTLSNELRQEAIPEGMAYVFVGRDCPISLPRHTASIDGGERVFLECMRFHRFSVAPGQHHASFSSTENTERLEFDAAAGDLIYIKMGWKTGGGTGDVKVVPELVGDTEGKAMVASMQAVE